MEFDQLPESIKYWLESEKSGTIINEIVAKNNLSDETILPLSALIYDLLVKNIEAG